MGLTSIALETGGCTFAGNTCLSYVNRGRLTESEAVAAGTADLPGSARIAGAIARQLGLACHEC